METVVLFDHEKETRNIGAMTIAEFRSHLVNKALFMHKSYMSLWLGKVVLMPEKHSYFHPRHWQLYLLQLLLNTCQQDQLERPLQNMYINSGPALQTMPQRKPFPTLANNLNLKSKVELTRNTSAIFRVEIFVFINIICYVHS